MTASPWLAPLMTDYAVVWCPDHLRPYEAQWPLGAPTATVYVVEAAAEKIGQVDSYARLAALVEAAPLCCYLDRSTLGGIYGRTVPL
jgi:hypothetical protein